MSHTSKAVASAFLLVLLTVFAFGCIGSVSTVDAADPIEINTDLDLAGLNDAIAAAKANESYEVNMKDHVINLDPIIPTPENDTNTRTIDGLGPDGDIVTIKSSIGGTFDFITIKMDPEDTYILANLIISVTSATTSIVIGEDDTSGGTVELHNVKVTGSNNNGQNIDAYCDELIITESELYQGSSYYLINMQKGALTVENSVLTSYDSMVNVTSGDEVTFVNCVLNRSGSGSALEIDSPVLKLTVTNCIFNDNSGLDTSKIIGIKDSTTSATTGNYVEIKGCLFRTDPSYERGASAISMTGEHEGEFIIDQCQFEGKKCSYDYISLSGKMSLNISNTTFRDVDLTAGGHSVLNVEGMDTTIVNSTFLNNKIEGSTDPGFLRFTDSNVVTIANNTFLDNDLYMGPSLLSRSGIVALGDCDIQLTNNIIISTDETLSGDVIPTEDPPSLTVYSVGNIVSSASVNFLLDKYSTNNFGMYAGLTVNDDNIDEIKVLVVRLGLITQVDLDEYYGDLENDLMKIVLETLLKDDGYFSQITTVLIFPHVGDNDLMGNVETGEADGKGVVVDPLTPDIDLLIPDKDQRGKEREGKLDIGAVSIKTATFNANGGEWIAFTTADPYCDWHPYFYYGSSGMNYSMLAAADVNAENKILLPGEYPLKNGTKILIGWSTTQSAVLPDEGYYDLIDIAEFKADTTYYAIWSEEAAILFDPGNEQGSSIALTQSRKVVAPTFGVVNGMRLVGWTYDDTMLDPNMEVTSNMVLTGVWEPAPDPVKVKVTFEPKNGEGSWSVDVAYGEKVAAPEDPTYEGYTFMGWYTQETGGTKWNFVAAVVKNMTLHAQWKENVAPIDPTDPTDPTDPDNPKDDGTASIDTVGVVAATVVGVLASVSIAGIATSPALAGGGIFMDGAVTDTDGQDKNRRTVLFFPRNGNSSWTSFVFAGRQVSVPSSPPIHPNGKPFLWWSLTPGGQPFDFMTSITSVTNLYAVYEGEVGVEGLDPEKSE